MVAAEVKVVAASPYVSKTSETVARAAEELKAWQPDLIALDCLGYTIAMKEVVGNICSCPVLLARTTLARAAAELLGC